MLFKLMRAYAGLGNRLTRVTSLPAMSGTLRQAASGRG